MGMSDAESLGTVFRQGRCGQEVNQHGQTVWRPAWPGEMILVEPRGSESENPRSAIRNPQSIRWARGLFGAALMLASVNHVAQVRAHFAGLGDHILDLRPLLLRPLLKILL